MISQVQSLTLISNAKVVDISSWQTASLQIENPSGTFAIQGSNDNVTFYPIAAKKMSDETIVTTIVAAGLYKFDPLACKFIKIGGAAAAADTITMFLTKPF